LAALLPGCSLEAPDLDLGRVAEAGELLGLEKRVERAVVDQLDQAVRIRVDEPVSEPFRDLGALLLDELRLCVAVDRERADRRPDIADRLVPGAKVGSVLYLVRVERALRVDVSNELADARRRLPRIFPSANLIGRASRRLA
jgi:hypothetical protein